MNVMNELQHFFMWDRRDKCYCLYEDIPEVTQAFNIPFLIDEEDMDSKFWGYRDFKFTINLC